MVKNGLKPNEWTFRFRFRKYEEILQSEGAEALAEAAQRSNGCLMPGGARDQAGWGFRQPDLVSGVLAQSRD